MESPFWKRGILIVFVLLSCLSAVESVATSRTLQKTGAQAPTKRASNAKTARAGSKSPLPKKKYTAADLDKQEFLAAHNKIRFIHGEPPFIWDPKLALYAKQYLARRYNDCKMVHSTGPHGENLFWGSGGKWKASDAVKYWAGEIRYYNGASNACQAGKMCGHYTQIVWRDSVRLGCVRGLCKNGGTYIVCEYDPPGNFDGESPFDAHNR